MYSFNRKIAVLKIDVQISCNQLMIAVQLFWSKFLIPTTPAAPDYVIFVPSSPEWETLICHCWSSSFFSSCLLFPRFTCALPLSCFTFSKSVAVSFTVWEIFPIRTLWIGFCYFFFNLPRDFFSLAFLSSTTLLLRKPYVVLWQSPVKNENTDQIYKIVKCLPKEIFSMAFF